MLLKSEDPPLPPSPRSSLQQILIKIGFHFCRPMAHSLRNSPSSPISPSAPCGTSFSPLHESSPNFTSTARRRAPDQRSLLIEAATIEGAITAEGRRSIRPPCLSYSEMQPFIIYAGKFSVYSLLSHAKKKQIKNAFTKFQFPPQPKFHILRKSHLKLELFSKLLYQRLPTVFTLTFKLPK